MLTSSKLTENRHFLRNVTFKPSKFKTVEVTCFLACLIKNFEFHDLSSLIFFSELNFKKNQVKLKVWSIRSQILNPISKRYLFKGARYVTDTLWMLMESGIEEVKILQTLTLLLTSSHVVQNETLAKCLVICLRLNFTKGLIFLLYWLTDLIFWNSNCQFGNLISS